MKNSANSKQNLTNLFLWVGIILLTLFACYGVYYFHLSPYIRFVSWTVTALAALLLIVFTTEGKKLFAFGKEAKYELEKVVWPTRQETTQITMIVMVMVTATGFVLWGIDSIIIWAIAKLTQMG
ncbi:MAG: preprotein translocase subunit SecE [Legionella sp.]|nr:preprotein translocase subunit SecE [Legionella sp.]